MARQQQTTETEQETPQDRTQRLAEQFSADLDAGTLEPQAADEDGIKELIAAQKASSEQATQMAQERTVAAEHLRRERMEQLRQGKKLAPLTSSSLSVMDDPTLPLDRDGKLAGTPDTVKKWVRTIDAAENPNAARAGTFARMGFKPVLSREDGKPITQMSHILMEAPVEADAKRRADAMQGRVAAGKDAERAYHASIEGTNRQLGYEAVQPFAGEDHGKRRRFAAVTPEDLKPE